MSDDPQVLRVIDAHEPTDRPYRGWPPLMDWIREHGADPNDVRRIEVMLLDAPLVRFHELVRGPDGQIQAVRIPGNGLEIAVTARDVPLRRMPPEHRLPR